MTTMTAFAPLRSMRRWMRYRRDLAALARLDDRLLHDLGITRGEIDYLARRDRVVASARQTLNDG
jgi:uncharacterized protein YjiS (DUF1127 family)